MKQALIILLAIAAKQVAAQNDWTMQQCMQYAVEHNHEVKQAELKTEARQLQGPEDERRWQFPAIRGCQHWSPV